MQNKKDKIGTSMELSKSENCLNAKRRQDYTDGGDDSIPPPVPPLPVNYQRSDGKFIWVENSSSSLEPNLFLCISDESYLSNDNREHKKQRAQSKASRQAELKR